MNNRPIGIAVLLVIAFAPMLANAQTAPAKPVQAKPASAPAKSANQMSDFTQGIDKIFADMDTDKNKQISFEEFKVSVVNQRRQMFIIEKLRENFKASDKNGNGTLEIAEFNALPGLQNMPPPKPAFATFDLNKDQKMDFREYVEFVGKISTPAKK